MKAKKCNMKAKKYEEGGKVTFGQAFKQARQSGQRTFEYKGKKYGTRLKDESDEKYKKYLASKSKTTVASKSVKDVSKASKAEDTRKAAAKKEAMKPKGTAVPRAKRESDLISELKQESTAKQAKADTKKRMDEKKPKSGSAVSRSQREDNFVKGLKQESTRRAAKSDETKRDMEKFNVKKPKVDIKEANPKRGLTSKKEKKTVVPRKSGKKAIKPNLKAVKQAGKLAIATAGSRLKDIKDRKAAKAKANRSAQLSKDTKMRADFLKKVTAEYDRKKGK